LKHYVGNPTKVRLQTGIDISTGTAFAIDGMRPDGSTFSWPAQLDGTQDVVYDNPDSRSTLHGTWRVWAVVTLPGRSAPFRGEPFVFTVYQPGA
jgi:hypothetical protein